MANISSNNLTSLYGGNKDTVITTTVVPNVAGTIPSKNLTTLYSGSGAPVTATTPYGNANVERFLNIGTDGGNTVTNIVATGNITIGNITANGNVTADYFIGNFVGNVTGTANFANYAGNVTVASQPNITSLGTLTGLTSNGVINFANAGNINLGTESNIHISGGAANYALITDGAGNLSWGQVANAITANFANYAGNVTVAGQGNITSLGILTGLTSNGVVNFANASNVNIGSNSNLHISGGAANYALITDGAGNLSWGQVANAITANFANYAGNVTVNAQPNITSLGTLTSLSVTGNSDIGNLNSNGNIVLGNYSASSRMIMNGDNTVQSGLQINNGEFVSYVDNNPTPFGWHPYMIRQYENSNLYIPSNRYYRARGTVASPANVQVGDFVAWNDYRAYSGPTATEVTVGDETWIVKSNDGVGGVVADYSLQSYGNITLQAQSNITLGTSGNVLANVFKANYLYGDGSNISNINGANVSNVATANFAAYAGNVTVNAQPNITSLGNLPYLQVSNSANATGVVNQFGSNNITFATNSSNVATYQLTTIYHPNASTAYPGERIIRSRGNVTTPTTAASGDRVFQRQGFAYNGNTNVLSVGETWTLTAGGTLNSNANQAYAGGQINWFTGNPAGSNLANANALSGQNQLVFNNSGGLVINPGTAPNSASLGQSESAIFIQSWGRNTTDLASVGGINSQKARGNRDSALSVQPGDQLGRWNMFGYNGSNYQTGNGAALTGIVASDYVANASIIPIDMIIRAVSNTAAGKFTTFYGNGTVTFPGDTITPGNITGNANIIANNDIYTSYGNITANGGNMTLVTGVFYGNGSGLTNINGANVNTVANANYANFANVANVANSVAVANVVGIGNIAVINLDGNGSNALLGNGAFGPVEVTSTTIANGTSNVNIPIANGNVNISSNGVANIISVLANGVTFITPPTTVNGALTIDSFGNPLGDVHRINSRRARGNATTPLSVNPGDATMRLLTFGHNGTAYQLSSTASIRGVVDNSYVANGANIPFGWQIVVNDTNGGINNQQKTHTFFSNGAVSFANNIAVSGVGNISGSNIFASQATLTSLVNVGNSGVTSAQIKLTGDKTTSSSLSIDNAMFVSTIDNANTATGFSSFFFNTYESANTYIPPSRYFRARGTLASPAAVTTNDSVQISSYAVYADSGNTYLDVINTGVYVTGNDGLGNVSGDFYIQGFNANSNTRILTDNTYANNFTANSINSGTGNIGNLQLNQFQEDVYAIGSTSGTITPDFNNGSIQSLTLTGSITLNSLANSIAGRSMTLIITQGGVGSYTLTSSMLYAGGYKILSTSVGAKDIICIFYDGTTYWASLTTGYA